MWTALWLYAQTSPQVSWLQSTALSAFIAGCTAIAVAVFKDRSRNKVEEKRLSIDVFAAHKGFYDRALELQTNRTADVERQLAVEQEKSRGLQNALTSMREKWDRQAEEIAACNARVALLEGLLGKRNDG